jgi:membrane fusion protein (multidrug efflux system)
MNSGERNIKEPRPSGNTPLLFLWRNLPRLTLLATIFLIIIIMMVISGEKKRLEKEKMTAQAQDRKPVNTVLLELRPTVIQDAINLPGVIEPWVQLELMAKVSGTIEEVLVREGSVVKEGDLLARIEPDDYRIALDSAKAAYKLAKADYERAKVMLTKKALSIADLESMETKVTTAKASMENAALRLSRCSITAPMDGVISRLNAKVGLFLSVGDPVGQMLQIDRVKAVIGIPESDVNAVRKISEVAITIQSLDNRKVTGRKYFLAPAPETFARIYRLELEIDNRDGAILPGMFLRAHVVKNIIHEAVVIPLYSVISRNDEQFVFVALDGVAQKRQVKVGIIEKWHVQVTEGLEPGEKIVVEGHRDVEDGQEIEVIQVITDPGSMQL